MTNDILTTVHLLSTPGQKIEVRAITEDGVASGYFDSPEELAAKVEALDSMPNVQGIYVTINEINPSIFSRRANRIKMRLGKKDATTADSDIIRRQWLPVDIDPVRPSGVSSTNAEHDTAIATARRVAEYLAGLGFPAPVLADSGNGAHLLYSIDLPNDDASRLLVKRCLEVLKTLFSDDRATIDTANFNAGRIWKLYGTMSRKGDNTTDRPHRRSRVLAAPLISVIVGRDVLELLAGSLPVTSPPSDTQEARPGFPEQGASALNARSDKTGGALDLRAWLSDHGITVSGEKLYEGETLYPLDECPFSGDHKDGAYAIQFANGAIHAGCHHESCGGGKQRWQELRERYEPKVVRSSQPVQKKVAPPRLPPGVPPVPAMAELPGSEEALGILQHGDPKQEMLRTFALDHEGDETVAECLILSIASRSIINTKGLHVSVTGESGKGKSHAFDMMILQMPLRFQLCGSMSNKALFYIENLLAGTAIVLDDKALSEDMADILKGVTTSFQKPYKHHTVNKDRKGIICTVPERCVWWLAKVEGIGDDQVFNRMLTCWIDDSINQDDRVLWRNLGACETVPEHGIDERPDVLMCRTMWEMIGQQRYYVIIPFATKIQFQAHSNRRNPEMLLDMIKSNAILCALQRERKVVNGLDCVVATRTDFDAAVKLYALLNSSAGGQDTKLTKTESAVIDAFIQSRHEEFTIPALQKATGLANNTLHRLLHGYASRGASYTGLLEKCPAIAYTDRTVVIDNEFCDGSTRRRTNAYTFDRDLYAKWGGSAAVWIKEDDEGLSSSIAAVPQQSRSNVVGLAKPATSPDLANKSYNTHLDLSNILSHSKSEITRKPANTPTCSNISSSDIGVAAGQDPKTKNSEPCSEPEAHQPQNSPQQIAKPCCGLLEDKKSHAGELMADRQKIHAVDYKRLDVPESHAPCFACGKKGSWYVEKLTAERRARPKDQQAARRLCRKCYDIAVRRDRAAAPPLPGVINLGNLERCSGTLGKCSVCNLSGAVYLERATGTKLCKACHSREAQRQCHNTGVSV